MASSRRATASSLSSSSILADCLRRLASLSATSSWFSVNHAIRFSSSATRAPCLLSSSASCAASCAVLDASLVDRLRSAAGHLRLRRSRRRSRRRVALANELALALGKLELRRLERRLGGELPLQVPSPVAAGSLRLESKPRTISPLSLSICPLKSPSFNANSRRIALIVAVAVSFSFWYPRMMASWVWISRRMDSASSTETTFHVHRALGHLAPRRRCRLDVRGGALGLDAELALLVHGVLEAPSVVRRALAIGAAAAEGLALEG